MNRFVGIIEKVNVKFFKECLKCVLLCYESMWNVYFYKIWIVYLVFFCGVSLSVKVSISFFSCI